MPNNQKQMNREIHWAGPCPACGNGFMTRKTKDVNSQFMWWIECASDACAYEADFEAFRTAWAAAHNS
jgi:hypothetical protein